MMKFRRFLAVALLLAVALSTPAYAGILADNFFQSYSISMSHVGTTIHISFNVTAVETSDVLGVLSYDVQRLVNGTWTTVGSALTGSVGSDTASYSFSKNYSAVAGYSYRVKAKYYCKKYNGTSETVTVTSSSISV
jgi:hypothetical protein